MVPVCPACGSLLLAECGPASGIDLQRLSVCLACGSYLQPAGRRSLAGCMYWAGLAVAAAAAAVAAIDVADGRPWAAVRPLRWLVLGGLFVLAGRLGGRDRYPRRVDTRSYPAPGVRLTRFTLRSDAAGAIDLACGRAISGYMDEVIRSAADHLEPRGGPRHTVTLVTRLSATGREHRLGWYGTPDEGGLARWLAAADCLPPVAVPPGTGVWLEFEFRIG